MRSGIAPMKAKARMLQSHRDMILDYFLAKKEYSSCVVEGLNTKVKLVTGKSYGYRMTATIKIAPFIYSIGRLPEPESPTDLPEESSAVYATANTSTLYSHARPELRALK